MAGRNPKYTPETVKSICDAIKLGGSDKDACVYASVDDKTFYRWLKQYNEFSEQVTRARVEGKLQRIGRIAKAGVNGDWRADAWYLERRWPEEFAQQLIIKISSDDAALLKRHGLSPSDAWQAMMQELADAENTHE